MKIGPNKLRFFYPVWTLFRGQMTFLGKENTLHLQETALVVEGELLRLRLPILDRFVQRVFCEWSMVTIPYARIVRHTYCTYATAKILWWLLVAALLGFLYWSRSLTAPGGEVSSVVWIGLVMLLLGWMVHRLLLPRYIVVFRQADGKRRLICFRLLSAKQRKQFTQLLKANRATARSQSAPKGA